MLDKSGESNVVNVIAFSVAPLVIVPVQVCRNRWAGLQYLENFVVVPKQMDGSARSGKRGHVAEDK
jgi:hypothetical protein